MKKRLWQRREVGGDEAVIVGGSQQRRARRRFVVLIHFLIIFPKRLLCMPVSVFLVIRAKHRQPFVQPLFGRKHLRLHVDYEMR